MKIPQCFLSPVFSTSQWQLPFQKENPSGNLATRIVSLAFNVIYILHPFFKNNVRRIQLKLSFQSKIDLHKQNTQCFRCLLSCFILMVAATLNLKLKPLDLNIPTFHITLFLTPTFIFINHCRDGFRSRNRGFSLGIMGITLALCVVCTALLSILYF